MDTSYSIRLGIEDQAAVEKAFAAIGEAGKTALATVRGAAGTASSGLGAVSDGASEIAHGFDVVSASATGLAAILGTAGLPMVAAKALALAEATENVATALRTAGVSPASPRRRWGC